MKTWISKLRLAACLAAIPGIAGSSVLAENCALPGTQCAAPQYAPNCYRPCPPTGEPQGQPVAPGMFVAPPASGEIQGESNSVGFHGPALRIPESVIRMPSLQMPCMVKYRRNPEMLTDHARATFQSQPAARLQFARPQAAPAVGAPQGQPATPSCNQPPGCYVPQAPWCAQNGAPTNDEVAKLQQQVAQLTAIVGQLAAMQQGQQIAPPIQSAGYQAVRPAAYEPPRAPTPSPAEQQFMAQYEQKCRELAEMQDQLASVQWEYQALLEAKQQQIAKQRDARLRKQLGEATSDGADQHSNIEPAVTYRRTAPEDVSRTEYEAVDSSPIAGPGRAPLRLRGQLPSSAPQAGEPDSARLDATSANQESAQPVRQVQAADDQQATVEETAPTGSRFGRWFKRSK